MASTVVSSRDVIIRTEAFTDAVNFYRSILGFKVANPGDPIVGFETGSIRLYVEQGKPHGPVFDFLVADVQATKQRLIAAGCTVVEENPAVPRCYLRDPFGLVFNLGKATG